MGLVVGLMVFTFVMVLNPQEAYGSLVLRICDGFFVATVIVLGFGGLVWCRNKGAFDMITFGVSTAFHLHYLFSKDLYEKKEDFYDYKVRKAAARKPVTGILIAGAIYLGLSIVMLIVYYIVG